MAQLATLPHLERLFLARVRLKKEEDLGILGEMRALRSLTLDYLPVTDKTLESLRSLPALEELSLDSTNITDRGAEILKQMPTLRRLDIYHTPVSKKAHEELQSCAPAMPDHVRRSIRIPNRRVVHGE